MSRPNLEDEILKAIQAEMSRKVGPSARARVVKEPVKPKHYTSPPFSMDANQTHALREMIKGVTDYSLSQGVEIEASIGDFVEMAGKSTFFPGLKTAQRYNDVLEMLEQIEDITKDESRETVRIISELSLREIKSANDVIYQTKRHDWKKNINIPEWGLRIKRSTETPKDIENFEELWQAHIEAVLEEHTAPQKGAKKGKRVGIVRERARSSFYNFPSGSNFYGFKLDITDVKESVYFNTGRREVRHRYEMEMELFAPDVVSDLMESLNTALTAFLVISQGVESSDLLMDTTEIGNLVESHNRYFKLPDKARKYAKSHNLESMYINKPRNLKIDDMLQRKFADSYVTVKYDGERKQLWVSPTGTYLLSPPRDIVKISTASIIDGSEDIFLFDTEVQGTYIYIFDAMIINTRGLVSDVFANRKDLYEKAYQRMTTTVGEYEIKLKEYFTEGSIYNRTNDALFSIKEEYENDPDLEQFEDGLIIQPAHFGEYKNPFTFKWKPADKLTIDLLLRRVGPERYASALKQIEERSKTSIDNGDWISSAEDEDGTLYTISAGLKGGKLTQFTGTYRSKVTGYILIDDDTLDGKVVELHFDSESKSFKVYRVRYDRTRPNGDDIVRSVWVDIMSPISEDTLRGVTMKALRRYHNMYKKNALALNFKSGNVILDIGSGRGGDLSKWRSVGLKKVYAVEPNTENLEEFKKRYEDGDFSKNLSVEFLNYRAEQWKSIGKVLALNPIKSIAGSSIHGITSFFSLTFFFKNEKRLRGLLRTLSLTPHRGKFVGSVMDGGRVKELLRIKPSDARLEKLVSKTTKKTMNVEYAEEYEAYDADDKVLWSITRKGEFTDSMFGNTIVIDIDDEGGMVRDQTEWLVDFDQFKATLKKLGFKLTYDKFLDVGEEYDALPVVSQEFSRLNRTFVFERYVSQK